MAYRRANSLDVAALESIRRRAILELVMPAAGEAYALDWIDSTVPERVKRAINSNEVWVADTDGDIAGWIEIEGNRIAALYVQPDVAGRGVGSGLLEHAENQIRSHGFHRVTLEASLNAERFYEHRGYEEAPGESRTDVAPMYKFLHRRGAPC